MDEQALQQMSLEILTEIKEWRRANPRATYVQIEEEIHTLVHLACFMPFDKVAQMMQEMVSVQTHEETVRRLTEQAGSWIEATQRAEVEPGGEPELENAQPLE